MKPRVPAHIDSLIPYPPGKPLEELEREYGIRDSIKLASNENPLGPSPKAVAAIQNALARLHRYPDGSGFYLRRKLSEKYQIAFDGILLGNGSNEIIELVIRAVVSPGDEVVMPAPSFLVYSLAVQTMGARGIPVALKDFHLDLKAMAAAVTEGGRSLGDTDALVALVADRVQVWTDRAPDPDQPVLRETPLERRAREATKDRDEPTKWWVYATLAGALAAGALVIYANDTVENTQRVELKFP